MNLLEVAPIGFFLTVGGMILIFIAGYTARKEGRKITTVDACCLTYLGLLIIIIDILRTIGGKLM